MTTPEVDELIRAGGALLRGGERERARALLAQAVRANPRSEQAWLLLAGAVTDLEQRRTCLERVLRINPGHALAQKALATLPPAGEGPQIAQVTQAGGQAAGSVGEAASRGGRPQIAQVTQAGGQAAGSVGAAAGEAGRPQIAQMAQIAGQAMGRVGEAGQQGAAQEPEARRPAAGTTTTKLAAPPVPIAISEETLRREAADRLLWKIVLGAGVALMLAGAAMAGAVALSG